MQCAKCGCPMEYTPLLDTMNHKLHRLFNCYHCLWQINKYEVLEVLKENKEPFQTLKDGNVSTQHIT